MLVAELNRDRDNRVLKWRTRRKLRGFERKAMEFNADAISEPAKSFFFVSFVILELTLPC